MQDSTRPFETEEFIRNQLSLPSGAGEVDLVHQYDSLEMALPLRPDIVFQSNDKLYFVEIKSSVVNIDILARMTLQREIWQKKTNHPPVQLVLAVKTINSREEALAQDLDIIVIKLPWKFSTPKGDRDYKVNKVRISSQKSWKIVTRLLKEKNSSIRQLALKEKVSYAWAYKVIELLQEQNVVNRDSGYVAISDVKNLLNGIAWERPMKNLQVEEIFIDFSGAHSAAQEISQTFKQRNMNIAFTTYTAAGLYTSYAIRQDAVYLYLERNLIDQFKDIFGSKSEKSIRAVLYVPDRNVFSEVRERESVIVVSPAQTLLDLAGLGYSAMDLTKVMVDKYADL
jgi:hypothetical protein